jgi:hypothetical protein
MAAARSFSLLKGNDYDWRLKLLITTMVPGTTMHKKKMALVGLGEAYGVREQFVLQIKFFYKKKTLDSQTFL